MDGVALEVVPLLQVGYRDAVARGDLAQAVAATHGVGDVARRALPRMNREALAGLDGVAAEVVPASDAGHTHAILIGDGRQVVAALDAVNHPLGLGGRVGGVEVEPLPGVDA